jgi:hypothetical protein
MNYLQSCLLLGEHLVGLLVLLDELASQLIVLSLQLLLPLVAHLHALLQIFNLLLLEGDGFLEGNQLPFDDAVP